jgi:hypothetical protein
MRLTAPVTKQIIRKLLAGEDYRAGVIPLIDEAFLRYVIDFFKRVASAKIENTPITEDWYWREFLADNLSKEEIAIHSGLNMKTISNMRHGADKEKVLTASLEHYDTLYETISALVDQEEVDIRLNIAFRGVSVDLTINESLIVINTLAVKRAALRGGVWSTAGKQVEKPLMATLCTLFQVPSVYFDQSNLPTSMREVDYYLKDQRENYHRCEVKLMGKGNPESADGALARQVKVFVADTLSESNKRELSEHGILWAELRGTEGIGQFGQILQQLEIPYTAPQGDISAKWEAVLETLFKEGML